MRVRHAYKQFWWEMISPPVESKHLSQFRKLRFCDMTNKTACISDIYKRLFKNSAKTWFFSIFLKKTWQQIIFKDFLQNKLKPLTISSSLLYWKYYSLALTHKMNDLKIRDSENLENYVPKYALMVYLWFIGLKHVCSAL